jgi:hypothetical protein
MAATRRLRRAAGLRARRVPERVYARRPRKTVNAAQPAVANTRTREALVISLFYDGWRQSASDPALRGREMGLDSRLA